MSHKPNPWRSEIVPADLQALTTAGQEQGLAQPGETSLPAQNVVEAEWVRRYPAQRRGQWLKYVAALLKVIVACGLTWLFYVIPPETFPNPFQNWKNPIVIFLLVCFIGKTLLDTFFYDHYQP